MVSIKQLKTFFSRTPFYPKTLTKGVYDEDGNRLDDILKNTFITTDETEYSGVTPRDADTLGGDLTKSGIIGITDGLSGRITQNSNAITTLNNKLTYSYNEKYIGKWVDGTSNIYEKSIFFDGGNQQIELTIAELPESNGIISFDGFYQHGTNIFQLNFYINETYKIYTYFNHVDKKFYMYHTASYNDGFGILTVRYIK